MCLSINCCKPPPPLCFLVSRRLLPLLQPGLVGFRLHLRLPARDQRQAPGGDRSAVREPALLLRRLGFRRRAPGGIHPRQRLKLPSIRQRRIRRGLAFEPFVGAAPSLVKNRPSPFLELFQQLKIHQSVSKYSLSLSMNTWKGKDCLTHCVHSKKGGDVLQVQDICTFSGYISFMLYK